DSNGNFTVPRGINRVILFHQGYQERTLVLYGKDIEIQLKPITVELGVSQITSNDTEARNLIRQVIQNKRKNSIENLKSYEYKSYSKFLLTASTDSMPYILFPKNERDSSYNDVRKLLDKSHLMLGERAMEHKFSSQYGSKN